MPIYRKRDRYQVQVDRADALWGYKRIRRSRATFQQAVDLEKEINQAIDQYGKWPVVPGDQPRLVSGVTLPDGTLRAAARLAIENHWKGTAYEKQVTPVVWVIVEFMEIKRKRKDLDAITSEDIEAYIKYCFEVRGSSANTVNHHLSALSTINDIALDRKPPLCTARLPIKRVKVKPIEKWWLRPEDLAKAVRWLEDQAEFVFADYLQTLAFEGLRVAEGLGLRERHITGLGSDKPRLKVPGSKTPGSQATIPVFPRAVPVLERSIERAQKMEWDLLFPMTWRHANETWKQVRAHLGVTDVRTATLQSVRRSFAHYANEQGMPTKTLQKVLRHGTIGTTDKYLQLVGGTDAEDARRYFAAEPQEEKQEGWGEVIAAYKSTGATPAEVAQFVKELMRT